MSEIVKTVSFPGAGWKIAADINFPRSFDKKKQYPAILLAYLVGSYEEQTTGNIYGKV
jgi:fermentation-respiration switch protein FrsA (DUF1100 family)